MGAPSTYAESFRNFVAYARRRESVSKAQLHQDLLVLFALAEKRGGYFVEVGASDGVELSNTYLLETAYGWRGILAEPARIWHAALARNRPGSEVDHRYVWSESGRQLEFVETTQPVLSTLASLVDADFFNANDRVCKERYPVETVTLNDLLAAHGAPAAVDYLSVDTEGSELDILRAVDFSKHLFSIITIEHNYRPDRERLAALLQPLGYVRVFDSLSAWDDWYVHRSALKA